MQIYVVARPALDEEMLALLADAQDLEWRRSDNATPAEELVEFSGRMCYLSFGDRQSPRSNDEYIANLIRQDHGSVLEHASWTFLITGISRACSHQLVRHRVGVSVSQLSQQYHDESSAPAVMPDAIQRSPDAAAEWEEAITRAQQAYRRLLELAEDEASQLAPRERLRELRTAARSVLPGGTETKVVMTANGRALRHFLRIRGSVEGDEEMRTLSASLLDLLRDEAPSLFADFRVEMLEDGLPVVRYRAR